MMGYQHQGMMNYGPHGHGGMGVPPGVMGGMGPPQGGPPGHGPSGQGSNMEKKIENYSFTLNNVLGKGSSGTVYKGKNDLTNTKVAIKCVDQRTLITEYAKELIRSQIEIMKQLDHPNIVKLHGFIRTMNNTYIITEFCGGGDLRDYMKKHKRMNEKEALRIMSEIVAGVNELAKHDIIHRDLKPANILVQDGVFKLTDFGFAKKVDDYEEQMMVSLVGTPLYMSPQILKRQQYSSKSDVWSMGLILYEMMYGDTPWPAFNVIELVSSIHNQPLRFNPNIQVSDETKKFIKNCLRIEEDDRFSVDDVVNSPIFQQFEKQTTPPPQQLIPAPTPVPSKDAVQPPQQQVPLQNQPVPQQQPTKKENVPQQPQQQYNQGVSNQNVNPNIMYNQMQQQQQQQQMPGKDGMIKNPNGPVPTKDYKMPTNGAPQGGAPTSGAAGNQYIKYKSNAPGSPKVQRTKDPLLQEEQQPRRQTSYVKNYTPLQQLNPQNMVNNQTGTTTNNTMNQNPTMPSMPNHNQIPGSNPPPSNPAPTSNNSGQQVPSSGTNNTLPGPTNYSAVPPVKKVNNYFDVDNNQTQYPGQQPQPQQQQQQLNQNPVRLPIPNLPPAPAPLNSKPTTAPTSNGQPLPQQQQHSSKPSLTPAPNTHNPQQYPSHTPYFPTTVQAQAPSSGATNTAPQQPFIATPFSGKEASSPLYPAPTTTNTSYPMPPAPTQTNNYQPSTTQNAPVSGGAVGVYQPNPNKTLAPPTQNASGQTGPVTTGGLPTSAPFGAEKYQDNMTQNYLHKQFEENHRMIASQVNLLKFLKHLRKKTEEPIKALKECSPFLIEKVTFILIKYSQQMSWKLKSLVLDQRQNFLGLNEWDAFISHDSFKPLAEKIKNQYYDTKGVFHQRFKAIKEDDKFTEDLKRDQDFAEIFNETPINDQSVFLQRAIAYVRWFVYEINHRMKVKIAKSQQTTTPNQPPTTEATIPNVTNPSAPTTINPNTVVFSPEDRQTVEVIHGMTHLLEILSQNLNESNKFPTYCRNKGFEKIFELQGYNDVTLYKHVRHVIKTCIA